MYDRILVPTDGSGATERAVEQAVDLARQYGATIHTLYAVDAGAYTSLEAGADIVLESLETEGESAVQRVADAARDAGVDVTTSIRTGTAHQVILDYADEQDCDLIVMGTHGRSGLNRYLLGSVTEKIVRSSDVPVLTVRSSDDGG